MDSNSKHTDTRNFTKPKEKEQKENGMNAQQDTFSEMDGKYCQSNKKEKTNKQTYIIKQKVKHIFWSEKLKTEDNSAKIQDNGRPNENTISRKEHVRTEGKIRNSLHNRN